MKKLFHLLVVLILILPFTVTSAPVQNFLWTHPQTYDDGTPLTTDAIAYYVIYCGETSGNYTYTATVVGGTTTSYPISSVLTNDGDYYCAITATDLRGHESAHSNELHFFIGNGQAQLAVPAAPGGFRVE